MKHFYFFFFFIKSETSGSFVNHFDGHFAYLKTLDFYFKFKEKQQVTEKYGLFTVLPLYPNLFSVCSKLTCMHFGSWDSAKEWNLTMPEGEIIQVRLFNLSSAYVVSWMQKRNVKEYL